MLWGITWMEIHKMLVDMPVHEYEDNDGEVTKEKDDTPKTDFDRFMAFNANL